MTLQSWRQTPENRIGQNIRGFHVLYSVWAAGFFSVSSLYFTEIDSQFGVGCAVRFQTKVRRHMNEPP